MFVARLFGMPVILRDDQQVSMPCRKAWNVLAILASAGDRPVPRSRLAGEIWPELEEDRARRALATTLWRIGKTTATAGSNGAQLLRIGTGDVMLHPATHCDLRDFRRLLAEAGSDDPVPLETAAALHHSDLLPDEDNLWCNIERESLRALLISALERLLDHYSTRADHANVIRIGQRLVATEPYLEHAHRALIRALGAMGERASAARQYDACAHLLRSELGLDPMPETIAAFCEATGMTASLKPAPQGAGARHSTRRMDAIARLSAHIGGAQRALEELRRI